MVDVALTFGEFGVDIALGEDLELDHGLTTAVILSLWTDGRAKGSPPYPDGTDDPRGWWGDAPRARLGSSLWEFERGRLTTETIESVRATAQESLGWLVAEKIAGTVTVTAQRGRGLNTLELSITIARSPAPRWAHLWEDIEAAQAKTLTMPGTVVHLLFR